MISDIKQEILNTIPINSCCSYSFLNSLFSNAKTEYSENCLSVETHSFLFPIIEKMVKNFYPTINVFSLDDNIVISGEQVSQMLLDSGVIKNSHQKEIEITGLNENLLASECCKLTYLKTLYLTQGNFYYNKNNNEKSYGYCVEFSFRNLALADDCSALMKFLGLKVGSVKRNNTTILYIKNIQDIYELFVYLSAVETAMEIQNNALIRELRNDANRQGNCFDANLNKTLSASREQVKAIDYIIKNYGIDYLDESLREVALIRIANEDITLNEMQKLYSTKISRAGLKYKLDKIISIYKSLID
ncbi:MAG: DNA-binding protein WhiA [Clostridia bacterium]|nr:DNA-binding protein WhiA [Clostridia bacterium]